jgi:hypothetical protein
MKFDLATWQNGRSAQAPHSFKGISLFQDLSNLLPSSFVISCAQDEPKRHLLVAFTALKNEIVWPISSDEYKIATDVDDGVVGAINSSVSRNIFNTMSTTLMKFLNYSF